MDSHDDRDEIPEWCDPDDGESHRRQLQRLVDTLTDEALDALLVFCRWWTAPRERETRDR